MTEPRGIQMDVERQFPRDRKEAAKVAEVIRQQAKIAGCTCRQIKIDFVDPPLLRPYVQVGHDVLCPLSKPT